MDMIKKHVDTVVVLGAMFGAFLWMNAKFNTLEKEITVIKTVMMMNGHYPKELIVTSKE